MKCKLVLLLLVMALPVLTPGQDVKRIEYDIDYHYNRIDYWRSRMNNDSVVYEKQLLLNRLLTYTNDVPATLRENFKYLRWYDHLQILTSDDKSFRIYSFDVGTKDQHSYINVFQYSGPDKSVHASISIPGSESANEADREYTRLYSLKVKGRIYYMATYVAPRVEHDYSVGMQVFSKNGSGMLDDSTHIIVNNSYGTAVNQLEFDMANASGAVNHCIYFNKYRRQLYVPIIWKDGVVSTSYITYRFKDNYFTEVKQGK